MKLYNTLAKSKQEFKPLTEGVVKMYHCGPTVYWTQHIGNMRAMVMADVVVRTFEYLNYHVELVRNYTDVGHLTSDDDFGEDKMERAAKRESLEPLKIAQKYIDIFEKDSELLNLRPADHKPRATECIADDISMVKTLLEKGYAYSTPLAIYFDISRFEEYGKLSGQSLTDKLSGAGKAEVDDKDKKNPSDFALWFFKAGKHQNALQTWESPFESPLVDNGRGFPGWHIECSVMAQKFLGKTIDIHMGGVEHIPVHHTNEIAQSEAASGQTFANYWLHNEHLTVDGGKMSKSEGTAYSLEEIVQKGYDPLALRYFFLQAHYRSKQNFTWQALDAAQTGLQKLYDFMRQAEADDLNKDEKINKYIDEFKAEISDDFNTPKALAVVWNLIKDNEIDAGVKKSALLNFDQVLGLKLGAIKKESGQIPDEIKKLAEERLTARQNKNWSKSDELRKKIDELGFIVKDTAEGFEIKKK